MPYIYEGHMGDLYMSDNVIEDTYCEQCGDSDWLIGYAKDKKSAWTLLKPDTDINGSGGWDYEYVQELINESFDE